MQIGDTLDTRHKQHYSLKYAMESEKDTIETLRDIVSSMEKEIGENRVGFNLDS